MFFKTFFKTVFLFFNLKLCKKKKSKNMFKLVLAFKNKGFLISQKF